MSAPTLPDPTALLAAAKCEPRKVRRADSPLFDQYAEVITSLRKTNYSFYAIHGWLRGNGVPISTNATNIYLWAKRRGIK